MLFGAITIVCGILGTLSGGFILDRMNATIPNAFKVILHKLLVRHAPGLIFGLVKCKSGSHNLFYLKVRVILKSFAKDKTESEFVLLLNCPTI